MSGLAQRQRLDYSRATGLTKWPTGRMPTPYTSLARYSSSVGRGEASGKQSPRKRALSFLQDARRAERRPVAKQGDEQLKSFASGQGSYERPMIGIIPAALPFPPLASLLVRSVDLGRFAIG